MKHAQTEHWQMNHAQKRSFASSLTQYFHIWYNYRDSDDHHWPKQHHYHHHHRPHHHHVDHQDNCSGFKVIHKIRSRAVLWKETAESSPIWFALTPTFTFIGTWKTVWANLTCFHLTKYLCTSVFLYLVFLDFCPFFDTHSHFHWTVSANLMCFH